MHKNDKIFSNLSITVDLRTEAKKEKKKNLSDAYYDFYFPGCKVEFLSENGNSGDSKTELKS